jgi:HEAT repeat protein
MADPLPDPSASFTGLLGHLIYLMRESPGEEAAVLRTVELMAARVARTGLMVEAGIENSWALDGDPLKERLQVRQVDAIGIGEGATAMELLQMGRALADDTAPIPSTSNIRVKLLPDPMPIQFSGPRPSIPDSYDALPRARQGDQFAAMIDGILRELQKAIDRQHWLGVLHDAQAAVRAIPNLNESARRTYTIALKRQLTLPVLEALIEQGYRMVEERDRTAEVLRAGGFAIAERMMDILKKSGTIGPRAFLLDALGGMPEAEPLFPPLLRSSKPSDVKLAVELIGRTRDESLIPLLVAHTQHPDEAVRNAVVDALARSQSKAAIEPLRKALTHAPSPSTRAKAARALSGRSSGAIAMPLFAAFEGEKDPEAWREMLTIIAGLNSQDAAMGLARMALQRRGFLSFGGGDLKRRLSIVHALAESGNAASRQALEYIVKEGDGEVQMAANASLENPRA